MNIDLYELNYRNYNSINETSIPETKINASERTFKFVINTIEELKYVKSGESDKIKFSDVICMLFPVINNESNNISFIYKNIFVDGNEESNPNEYVERFKKLDINTLPLIEVAKYLNIQVEKSNILKPYGEYDPVENKIILGTDYIKTFIHELAHAIDRILDGKFDWLILEISKDSEELEQTIENYKDLNELVAELSAVVLCKKYNISFNISGSKCYLDSYSNAKMNINNKYIINRVSLICEYINKCLEEINITAPNKR